MTALAVAVVWLAPGYALLAALAPKLRPLARWALAIPCSFALCAIGGSLLDNSPFGLHSPGLLLALGLLTTILLPIAALRPGSVLFRLGHPSVPALTAGRAAGVAFGALLLLGVAAWARNGLAEALQPPAQAFTTLALTSHGQLLVQNEEGVPATYHAEMVAGGRTIAQWPGISLAPGAEWTAPVPPLNGSAEVVLYRGGNPQPYRKLILGAH